MVADLTPSLTRSPLTSLWQVGFFKTKEGRVLKKKEVLVCTYIRANFSLNTRTLRASFGLNTRSLHNFNILLNKKMYVQISA